MLINFEEYTRDLTSKDIREIKLVAELLSKATSPEKAITNKSIRISLFVNKETLIKDSKIRKIIHWIRSRHMIKRVIATSKGYYIATNDEEFIKWIRSMEQRRNSLQEVIDAANDELDGTQTKMKL